MNSLETFISALVNEELRVKPKFDIEKLKKAKNAHAYVESTSLPILGSGVARTVYDLGNGTVLKVATDTTNGDQNEAEIELSACGDHRFIAKVIDHAPDNSWLIAEKLKTNPESGLTDPELDAKVAQMTNGVIKSISDLGATMATPLIRSRGKVVTKYMLRTERNYTELFKQLMETSEWYREFFEMMKKCGIDARDFHSGNFGIRESDGSLVLLDYGYSIY